MSTTKIAEQFIAWRIRGIIVAEKRLKMLLSSDVQQAASDQQLDALFKMISTALRDITQMQNEIITLQMIVDDAKKQGK